MTREEAQAASAQLNGEHPERDQFRWFAKRDEKSEWSVARMRLPKARASERLTTSAQGKQPPPPDEHPLDLPGGLPPWIPGG